MSHYLTADDFTDFLMGSQLGTFSAAITFPGAMESWVHELLIDHGPVHIIDEPGPELAPALAVASCAVGSLPALLEVPPNGDEARIVIEELEKLLGDRVAAIAPLNAAGPNALLALAAACQLDLPLLNCDGQGRIFPLIDQTTYRLAGISPGPMVGVGPWGDVVRITSTPERYEPLVRSALTPAGGWLFTALYPATVTELMRGGIPGALTRCLDLGRLLRESQGEAGEQLVRGYGGQVVGRGHVTGIHQQDTAPPSRLPARPISILIRDWGPAGATIRLEVRNEVVLATVDGHVAGASPDLICLIDPVQRRALDLIELRPGALAEVVVLPADPRWYTDQGRDLVGMGAFGLPLASPEPRRPR